MREELQRELDNLLAICESNGYKVHGKKVVPLTIKQPKLVCSVDVIRNIRYVGEVGWLRRSVCGDLKISNQLVNHIETQNPNKITFTENGDILFDDRFLMENSNYDIDVYELEDYDLHFIKTDDMKYELDTSNIDIDEDEDGMLYDIECTIHFVDKVKRIKEEEFTD